MTEKAETFLAHFGVKGMHWGQRKSNESGSSQNSSEKLKPVPVLTKKFSTGDEVSIYKNPTPPIARALARISPRIKDNIDKGAMFTLKDKDGHKVGEAGFYRDSKEELSLDWVGVRPKYRGKGYASAALQGVVKYAQDEGIKKLTLEVPGNSPDARHIYEKLGFREDKALAKKYAKDRGEDVLDAKDDIAWGGLTAMSLKVDELKHAEDNVDPWEEQYANEFAQMLKDNFTSEGDVVSHTDKAETFLAHFGVKGQKWGVRRSRGGSSSSTSSTKPDHSSPDAILARAAGTKIKETGLHSLSNQELQSYVNRLNLEQQYKRLNDAPKAAGKKFAQDLLLDTTKGVAKDYVKQGLKYGAKNYIGPAIKSAVSKK